MTLATLRDTLVADDLDHYRTVVEALCDEFDVMEVALAAVKLAHEATGAVEDDREIAEVSLKGDKPSGYEGKKKWDKPSKGDKGLGKTNWASKAEYEAAKKGKKAKKNKHTGSDMTTVFVGAGKESGVRPQDLVGAFTGETDLRGADIGAIKIFDRFSLVEVPDRSVDDVVHLMSKALIKGRKAKVRRERERG
jgi:ATP-dependent RNA helicase DeaD